MGWSISTGVGSTNLHKNPPNIKKDLIVSAMLQGYSALDALQYSLDHGYEARVKKFVTYCENELPETKVIGGAASKIYNSSPASKVDIFNFIKPYIDKAIKDKTNGINTLNDKLTEVNIAIQDAINKGISYTNLTSDKNTLISNIAYEQGIIDDLNIFLTDKVLTIVDASHISTDHPTIMGMLATYNTGGLYNTSTSTYYYDIKGIYPHIKILSIKSDIVLNPYYSTDTAVYALVESSKTGYINGDTTTPITTYHTGNNFGYLYDILGESPPTGYSPKLSSYIEVEFTIPSRPTEFFYAIIPASTSTVTEYITSSNDKSVFPTIMLRDDKTSLKTTDDRYPKYEKALKYLGVDLKGLLKGITDAPNSVDMSDIFVLFGINLTSKSQEVLRYLIKFLGGLRHNIPAKDYDPNNLPALTPAIITSDNLFLTQIDKLDSSYFSKTFTSLDFKSLTVHFEATYIYENIFPRTGIHNEVVITNVSDWIIQYVYQFSDTQAIELVVYNPILTYINEWIGQHKSGDYSNSLYPAKQYSDMNIIPLDIDILNSMSKSDQSQILFNSLQLNIFTVVLTYISGWMTFLGVIILIVVVVISYFVPPLAALLPEIIGFFIVGQIISAVVDAIVSGIAGDITKATINVGIAAVLTVLSWGSSVGQLLTAVLNLAASIVSLTASIMKLGFYDLIQKTEDTLQLIQTEQDKLDEQTSNLLTSKYQAVQGLDLLMNPNIPIAQYYNDKVLSNHIGDFLPKYDYIDKSLLLPPTSSTGL